MGRLKLPAIGANANCKNATPDLLTGVNDRMNRKELLDAAANAVLRDRNQTYGTPEDNFATTAQIMTAYLNGRHLLAEGRRLEAYDVASLMVALKLARLCTSPGNEDTWVDIAGYAATGVQCATPQSLAAPKTIWHDDVMTSAE